MERAVPGGPVPRRTTRDVIPEVALAWVPVRAQQHLVGLARLADDRSRLLHRGAAGAAALAEAAGVGASPPTSGEESCAWPRAGCDRAPPCSWLATTRPTPTTVAAESPPRIVGTTSDDGSSALPGYLFPLAYRRGVACVGRDRAVHHAGLTGGTGKTSTD